MPKWADQESKREVRFYLEIYRGDVVLNGLDLFSGIGGLSLAISEWVRPIAYCENDQYAQAVLLSRFATRSLREAIVWDDVRTLTAEDFGVPIDIIYGGFPCQDISAAGAGRGLVGERSGLYWQIERLVKEIKPQFVFLENVELGASTLSSNHLPSSGMIVGGQLYQPPKLAPRTSVDGGSFWPTPAASSYGSNQGGAAGRTGPKRPSLAAAVKLLPTPWASEATRGHGGGRNRKPNQHTLSQTIGGALNPNWVEWLMGYPSGWTALEDWATQWFRSKRGRRSCG